MGEYWVERWKAKARDLKNHPMKSFRRNPISNGIAKRNVGDGLKQVAGFVANKTGTELLRDSLIGEPPHILLGDVPVTMNSIEHAYMSYRIGEGLRVDSGGGPMAIVEIGGGYGGLAWALCRRFEVYRYVLIDHPVCLEIQKWFLGQALKGTVRFEFMTPYEIHKIVGADLAVNTRSFGEMDLAEVQEYIPHIERLIGPGGGFYMVNWERKIIGFDDIPLTMKKWREVYRDEWPRFIDANPMIEAFYERINGS